MHCSIIFFPVFQFFKSSVNPLAIDLIDKLLIYAPEKRLKACEALAHPFFDDLRKDNFKIDNKKLNLNLFDFSLGIFHFFIFKNIQKNHP